MNEVILVTADKELSESLKASLRETEAAITLEFNGMKPAVGGFPKTGATMVIIDYFLPDGSGLELLKVLKPADESCLFLLLLRVRTRSMMEKAFRYGAQDVLNYPVNVDVIREIVVNRLVTKKQDSEAEEIVFHKPAEKE